MAELSSASSNLRDALYRRTLAAVDVASAAFALVAGLLVAGGKTPALPIIAALPLVAVVNKVVGLYERDELLLRRSTLEEAPALLQGAAAYSLLVWIGGSFLVSEPLGRGEVLALLALLFASSLLARVAARRVLRRLAPEERCLVLGDSASMAKVAQSFESTPLVKAVVVGHVPMAGREGAKAPDDIGTMARLIEERNVDRVVVASGPVESDLMLHAVRLVKGLGVKVSVVPRLFEAVGSSARVDEIDGLLLLGLPPGGPAAWSGRLKRVVDIIGATALLVLLAPAVVPIRVLGLTRRGQALLAKSGSGRAVLHLSDKAVPSLLAVLRGHLSLVGPGPDMRLEGSGSDHSGSLSPGTERLRPGLTGLWRTQCPTGATAEDEVNLDYLYRANWSLWLDAKILIRSMPALFEPGRLAPPDAVSALLRDRGVPSELQNGNGRNGAGRQLLERAHTAPPRPAFSLSSSDGASEAAPKRPTVTAVVPATNSPPTLPVCVNAILSALDPPEEIIVVDDPALLGPAAARNAGAERATGDVLVFVDGDVVVHPDAFRRIRETFDSAPELTGVFGSYDDGMATSGRVGTFRNLLHHHVHHSCPGEARTFWSGLGAVRRDAFQACDGFDAKRYLVPSVEDIDLGMRLASGGARIMLNPKIQGTHLKNWGLREMLRTDFSRRGVPWVALLLRSRGSATQTLNLAWRHRLSAGSSLVAVCALLARRPRLALGAGAWFFGLNSPFYVLLARRHGLRTSAAGFALHVLHHIVSIAAVPFGLAAYLSERRASKSGGAVPTEPRPSQAASTRIRSLTRATDSDSADAIGAGPSSRIAS